MKLRSKIAVSAALLGAISTANAESITFGVEIPPIASISVTQGLLVTANALRGTVASATPNAAPFIGAFTVSTNMPKWNVYFSLANNGYLVDQNGNYLKDNNADFLRLGAAASDGTTAGRLWIKFPSTALINGNDRTGTGAVLYDGATSALQNLITDGNISNIAAGNTLTAILRASTTLCDQGGTPAQCADNGWIYATAPTLATFGLGTMIDNTNPVNAIAGSYTETLYMTLVTAY
jgi:hypothetical protein